MAFNILYAPSALGPDLDIKTYVKSIHRTMLNPFELLGVSIHTPLSQIRKNYYALALLAHPDVGGTTEDMITLKACYDWIVRQMTLVQEYPDKEYEATKTGFEKFLQDQIKDGIPPLNVRELCAETYGFTRKCFETMVAGMTLDSYQKDVAFQYVSNEFHRHIWKQEDIADLKAFVLQKVAEITKDGVLDSSTVPHGYGSMMDTEAEVKDISFGTTEMVVYQEPDSIAEHQQMGRNLVVPSQLEDYSNEKQCDYKRAFQWPLPEKEWTDTTPLEERLLAKQMERQL